MTTGNVLTGAYSVGLNGSGTLNLDNSNGFTEVWDIYAIAPNHAYLMDASTANVGMGELEPQFVGAPFGNTDIEASMCLDRENRWSTTRHSTPASSALPGAAAYRQGGHQLGLLPYRKRLRAGTLQRFKRLR